MKYSEEAKNKKIEIANEYADIRKGPERPLSFSESADAIRKKAEEESEAAKERTKGKILRVLSYSGVKEEEKLSAQKIEEIVRGDVGKTLEELKAELRELELKFVSAPSGEKKIIEKTIEKKEERIREAESSVKEKTSVGGGWVDLAKYGSVRSEEEIQESVTGGKKISDIAHPVAQKEGVVEVNWEPMISSRLSEVKTVSELEDAMRFAFQKTGEKSVGEREKAFSAALALRRAIEEEKAPQFNSNLFPERFRASAKQVMDSSLLYDDEEFDVEKPAFLKKATDTSFKIESVGTVKDLATIIALKIPKEEGIIEDGKKYSYDALQNKLVILGEYLKNNEKKGGRLPQYLATLAESFPAQSGIREALFDVIRAKGFSLTEPLKTAKELAVERGGEILWEEKNPRTEVEQKEEEIAPVIIHTEEKKEEKKESSPKPVFSANDFAKTARENQEGIKNPKAFPFFEDEQKKPKTIPSKIEREEDSFDSMEDIFKFLTETTKEEKDAEDAEKDKQIAYKNARIIQWRNLIEHMHPADRKAFAEETRQIRSMYSFPDWDKKEESERQALNNERLNNLREVFLRHGFIPSAKKGESASPDNPWHWIPPKNTKKFDAQNAERYLVSYDDEKKGTGLLRGDKRYRTQTVNIEKENLDIDPTIEGAKTLEEFEDAVTARMEKGPIIERGNELPPEAMPALFGALEMYCENPDGDFYADGWPERHGIRATAKRIAEEAKKKIEEIDVEKLEKERAETIGELHSLEQKQKIEESLKTPVAEEKPEKKKEEKIPKGVFSAPSAPSPETPKTAEAPVNAETKEEDEKETKLTSAQKINALIVLGFLSEADQALIPTGEREKEAFLKKYTQYFEDLSECIKEEKTVSGKKDKKKGGVKSKEYKASPDTILKKASEAWEKQQAFNALYKEKVLKSMVERKSLSDTKYTLCDDAEKALSGAMTDLNKLLERGWRGFKEGGVKGLEKKDDKDVEKEIQKDAELVSAPFGVNERTGEPIVRSFRWMMIHMNRLAYERKQDAVSRSITEAWPTPEKKSLFERIPLAGRAIQKFNKLPKWARVAASVGLVSGSVAVGGGLVAGLSLGSLLGFMGIKVLRGVGGGIGGAALSGVLGRRIEEKSSETIARDKQFIASSMNSEMLREAQNENYLTNIRLKKYDDVAKLSSQIGERLAIAERVWLTSSRERVLKSEKFRRGLMMLTVALLAGGGTVAVTELLSGGVDTLANIKMPNVNIDPNSMKTMNPDMLGKIARDIQKGI